MSVLSNSLALGPLAIAGLASTAGVEVDDTRPIATSFPNFEALLDGLAR